jgi:hypothetical protein
VAQAALYLDECVDVEIALRLRSEGFDVETARDVHRLQAEDEEQLAFAAENGRVPLTHNRADFIAIAQRWSAEGRSHSGLMLCSLHPPGTIAGWVRRALEVYGPDDLTNCTINLPLAEPD